MTDAWHDQREEERTERRRSQGRRPDRTYDPAQHEPTMRDRLEIEPPLEREDPS